MEVKAIKTESDFLRAMKLIDQFMDAKPNTPRGDMLDVLVALAEKWEEEHYPIESPQP